jgi:hypothetical protein
MTTSYSVVLVIGTGEGEGGELWRPCGDIEVPMGTKRGTIIEKVLAGQQPLVAPGSMASVPQLGLEDGEEGVLLLIPVADVGDGVVVRASRRYVVEPTSQGGEA